MQYTFSFPCLKFSAAIFCFVLIPFSHGFAQGWLWSRTAGDSALAQSYAVVADKWDNVYVAGIFTSDTMTFGSIIAANAGDQNMYIAKYDANGNVLWAQRLGGPFTDGATCLAIDTSGNVYLGGYFSSSRLQIDTINLFNYVPVYEDFGSNTSDGFVAKFDSSGNVIWANSFGGTGSEMVNSVTVNNLGEVFVCGSYNSDTIFFGTDYILNSGADNLIVIKYDASGNRIWVNHAGGTLTDGAYSIATDIHDNVYVVGNFSSSSISFGATILDNNGYETNDVFIVKYNDLGAAVWAESAGGIKDDYGTSVATDIFGNVIMSGYFSSTEIGFGSDTLRNESSGFGNMFIVKYDSTGNVTWANTAGLTDNVFPEGLTTDTSGNTYLTGYFSSVKATFGNTTITNAGIGYENIFLTKYLSSGYALWAIGAGGNADNVSNAVCQDPIGNLYISGYYNNALLTLGTCTDTNSIILGNNSDMFIAKFNQAGMYVPIINTKLNQVFAYPNPANETINIILDKTGNKNMTMYDCLGKAVFNESLTGKGNPIQLDVQTLPEGTYFIATQNDEGEMSHLTFEVVH